MSDGTHIEWTDATWNPVTGCSVTSPGCANCYAMDLAGTRLKNHPSRAGLTREVNGHHVWTGEVRFNAAWLTQPLKWRRPRRIFVCAHGDLFHEAVPDEWIDRVFAVMQRASKHQFQVLTKRSVRAKQYLTKLYGEADSNNRRWFDRGFWWPLGNKARMAPENVVPFRNVWLGVSAEDQKRYDERKEDLRIMPAAVRFFSFEPLLSLIVGGYFGDWAIVGGESGTGARPMHPDWARSLRDQCAAASVPFFFKQWGEWRPTTLRSLNYERVGKKAAGRLLDGREHNGMPDVRP